MKLPLVIGMAALLGACAAPPAPKNQSVQQSIDEMLKQNPTPKAPTPLALPPDISHSLLPPLRDTLPRAAAPQAEPRFDLVVTDASISQVLHAIASDTRYSVLLSPKAAVPRSPSGTGPEAAAQGAAVGQELMTVRLKNVTVFEALDAVRDTYGYEYSVSGTRIYVEPPEMQMRLYQVNYTLGQRRGVSDLQVVSGAAAGGGGGSGSSGSGSGNGGSSTTTSGGGAASYGSNQASALSTVSKSDLWGEIEDSLRTILGCQIPRLQASTARAGQGGGQGGSGSSSSASSSRADVSYVGESQLGERQRGVDGCADGRAVNVNQMTGTVLVRGMPRELRTVERLLRAMQLNVERQVIIEAKVIDVQLNKDSQQGINWAAFHHNLMRAGVGSNPTLVGAPGTSTSGQIFNGVSTGDLLAPQILGGTAASAFSSGLGVVLQGAQFAALVNFLETQGEVRVLSSPRIATLNNQKAVIKVGTEEPFVTNIAPGTTSLSAAASIVQPPTITYQPFFSGISLDVTPQIDERNRVTLHVHAMVNSIVEKQKIASPSPGSVAVPLAVNSVNETDSMVKTTDGMMVVIGGLMTESTDDSRAAVPGLGDVPLAGALFRKGGQTVSKRELVILIRPTVVKMDADWSDDMAAAGRRMDDVNRGGAQLR